MTHNLSSFCFAEVFREAVAALPEIAGPDDVDYQSVCLPQFALAYVVSHRPTDRRCDMSLAPRARLLVPPPKKKREKSWPSSSSSRSEVWATTSILDEHGRGSPE